MALLVRYETRDQSGETRRQRNERFGQESPEIEWPEDGEHLWEWFWDLDRSRSSGANGTNPLSLTDIANWAALTGTIIRREEVAILRQMDGAYLHAAAEEQAAHAARREAEIEERAKAKRKGR